MLKGDQRPGWLVVWDWLTPLSLIAIALGYALWWTDVGANKAYFYVPFYAWISLVSLRRASWQSLAMMTLPVVVVVLILTPRPGLALAIGFLALALTGTRDGIHYERAETPKRRPLIEQLFARRSDEHVDEVFE